MKILISHHFIVAQFFELLERLRSLSALPVTSVLFALGVVILTNSAFAQTQAPHPAPGTLKKLSVEELMDVEVISVSRRPEKLSETASAIQVITSEDIRRSGASNIPEALRLAHNLQVVQKGSHSWGITARGRC